MAEPKELAAPVTSAVGFEDGRDFFFIISPIL
jgi:hypothetical protein